MKNYIILLCIFTFFIQNVQLIGQDFSEYKFCSQVAIEDADNYKNKGAGIAYNPVDNTIIMCLSDLSTLYVVDMDGTLLSTNPLVGFEDVEGLEILDDNTLVLVEETNRGNIVFLPLPLPTNQSINYPASNQIIHCPDYISNEGFESVAYDATNDILYWAKERAPITVFSLQNPLSYGGQDITPTSPWDINQKLIDAGILDFVDIGGMHFSKSNTLWITGEDKDMVIEVDPITGDILQTFENSRLKGKLQGITEGPLGEIIVMEHNNLYMIKFDDNCVAYNDCPKHGTVFFDFEQGMDLCNLEEINYSHWRRQKQEWKDYYDIRIEGAANGDYYFLLDEGWPLSFDKESFAEGPEIDLQGISDPAVKFDYILDNFRIELLISEDDGNTWEIAWTETDSYFNTTTFPMEWNQMVIPLDNYIDKNIKFRFKAIQKKTGVFVSALGVFALDAIKFGTIDEVTCDDADNDGVCNADDQCPGGPAESCNNYCVPVIPGNSSDAYISRVTLENIDNLSGNGEYNDFTGDHSTDLVPSNTYTLQMEKPSTTPPNTSFYWYVWIDYNRNDVFENSELIVSLSDETASSISESFTVPADASIGQTRMRVYFKSYSSQTPEPPGPCDDTSELAEVEDYKIFISGCEVGYILSGSINPQEYKAENYIISDGQVPVNGDVVFQAGNFVHLLPGFTVKADLNSTFHAFIAPCEGSSSSSKSDISYLDTDKMIAIRNYPNPFTGHTTIEFELSKDTPVSLFISDAMGRQVQVLLDNEFKIEGTHLTTFDGSNYPPGMYYYTIQAGEYIGTQKMILVK